MTMSGAIAFAIATLLFMVWMNSRNATYWRGQYEALRDAEEDIYVFREGEPRWVEMLHKVYRDKYYFECDSKGRVTRYGGTIWQQEAQDFCDENLEMLTEMVTGVNYTCQTQWIEGRNLFAVIAKHRVPAGKGSKVYVRCFICNDIKIARVAEFLFNRSKDIFAPPTKNERGFDLSFINMVTASHMRYSASAHMHTNGNGSSNGNMPRVAAAAANPPFIRSS